MAMLSKEQKDLLLLYQCMIDTGADVLREFTEPRLISGFNNFTDMLEKRKHYFFHQNNKRRLHSCECPSTGCSIPFNVDLDNKLFDKMYSYDKTIRSPKGHHINNGTIQQICLCRFTVNAISMEDFDLSNMNYLILKLGLLYPSEISLRNALKSIMGTREKIMHAVSSNCYSLNDLGKLWNDFETAILEFSPPKSSFLVKKLITKGKKELLSEEDIRSLMANASEKLEKKVDDHNTQIHVFEEKVSEEIKRCTTTVVGAVTTTEENIKMYLTQQFQPLVEGVDKLIGLIGNQSVKMGMTGLPTQQLESNNGAFCSELPTIRMTAELTAQSLNDKAENDVMENLPTKEDNAAGTSKDEEKIDLPSPLPDSNDQIEILKKKKNCILLELAASPQIFTSTDTLQSAILELIGKVLNAGNVDTSITDTIYVQMSFDTPLTQSQYSILLELMSCPYTERLEPKSEQPRQNKSENIDISEGTCRLCIDKNEKIALLEQTIAEKEQQNNKQKEDNIQQKLQIEKLNSLLDEQTHIYRKQIPEQQRDPQGEVNEEPSSKKPKYETIEPKYELQIRKEYNKGEMDQDAKSYDYEKDALKISSSVLTSRQNKYDIKCGKVIIGRRYLTAKEDSRRIEERFLKFPNFRVEHYGMFNISETLEQADILILILDDYELEELDLEWVLRHYMIRVRPLVIIGYLQEPILMRPYLEPVRQDLLLAGLYQGHSYPFYSTIHHLADAMENMKDGDDFSAILYDFSRKCREVENKDNRHLFYSTMSKDLVLS